MRLLTKELIGYMHELLSNIRYEVCKVVVLVLEGVCSDPPLCFALRLCQSQEGEAPRPQVCPA